MNTIVNFEIAQILKEKEYDEPCYNAYNTHGMQFANGWLEYLWENGNEIPFTKKDLKPQDILAPTIAEVVMWLYEKHGIWISVRINGIDKTFDYSIHDIEYMKGSLDNFERSSFIKPSYAYHEAILYTLKNLI